MRIRWFLLIVALALSFLAAAPIPGKAQTPPMDCPSLVSSALADLDTNCRYMQPGNACYGHRGVEVVFAQAEQAVALNQPGQQTPLTQIKTLRTLPLDLEQAQWGVAALHFGYNAPEGGDPGFMALLFGDASMTFSPPLTPQPSGFVPAQAFYFLAASTEPMCSEARALLSLRGPENAPIPVTVNGSEMFLKGLVSFRWLSANSLSATVHRGALEVLGAQTASAGQTLIGVADNAGTIVLWSAPRAATPEETAALDGLSNVSGVLAAFSTGCFDGMTHVVALGDNLYRIALRYKTSVSALSAANQIADPNRIYVGQTLRIACGRGGYAASAPPEGVSKRYGYAAPQAYCIGGLVIGPGQDVSRLAALYNSAIRALNVRTAQAGLPMIVPCR